MNVTIFKTMAGVVFKSTEFKLSKAPALSAYLLWSLSLGFLNTYKKKKNQSRNTSLGDVKDDGSFTW